MEINTYVIIDRKTGLMSHAGWFPGFSEKGDIWHSIGTVKQHISHWVTMMEKHRKTHIVLGDYVVVNIFYERGHSIGSRELSISIEGKKVTLTNEYGAKV